MRLNKLEGQDKIDNEYVCLTSEIARRTEEEIKKLRENINALKEKAERMGEALTNPSRVTKEK